MINRRRFISIAAAATAGAAFAHTESALRWRGVAMGADVSIDLGHAPAKDAHAALTAAIDTIRRMERLFSIYDPQSDLSRLNSDGRILAGPEFLRLMKLCGQAHILTGGLFDPTVQPLFVAKMQAREPTEAERACVGWNEVDCTGGEIAFSKPGMAMTLNGIAQGFATDRVTEVLASHGFSHAVVNIGEYRVGDRIAAIGLSGSKDEILAVEDIRQAAIATSVPGAFRLSDRSFHILNPKQPESLPAWASASVVAETAAMADALSTALVLANGTTLARKLVNGPVRAILLEGAVGVVVRI